MDKIVLLDPGHGGIIGSSYQTAPKKMYRHDNGEVAYEGVINRHVVRELSSFLDVAGVSYINICPTDLDLPLEDRVKIANLYCARYGWENVLGISLHSNAGGGHGFEIFTSEGESSSDRYASIFMSMFGEAFPGWRLRKDLSDGDPDKEAPFYILKHTKCAWILPEWGFFDNPSDWLIIKQWTQQRQYAEMIANFITSSI